MPSAPSLPHYRERLAVPVWWWAVGLGLALSLVVALGVYLPPLPAVLVTVAVLAVVVVALWWYGRAEVSVDEEALRADRFCIEWCFVGDVKALSPAETRERLGVGADPAAALAVRPYVARAVEVAIRDPRDPHPYWLLSSRRPERLAAAIAAHVRARAAAEVPGGAQT